MGGGGGLGAPGGPLPGLLGLSKLQSRHQVSVEVMLKWMLLCFCQVSVVVAINFLSEARKLRLTPIPVTDILNAK